MITFCVALVGANVVGYVLGAAIWHVIFRPPLDRYVERLRTRRVLRLFERLTRP